MIEQKHIESIADCIQHGVLPKPPQGHYLAKHFYDDKRPLIPRDPYFGLTGVKLRHQVLPALCGPMGRMINH